MQARAAGAGARERSGGPSRPHPAERTAGAQSADPDQAEATVYLATTPMLAIVSPFLIEGTAQT